MARKSLKNLVKLIEAEKEELTIEQSFLNDLKRSIEITGEEEKRKPSQTYKPSSMNCIRQSYYQIIGVEQDESFTSASFIGICNAGTDTHLRIQTSISKMKDNGIPCEWIDVAKFVRSRNLDYLEIRSQGTMETKLFHKEYNMSFMCDGIIKYHSKYYIIEIKTESSNKFFGRVGVDPSHYNQATAYSVAFGLDDVIFIYINRDTLDMKSFMFHVEDEMKSNLVGYISNCDSYIKKLKVPPKPENVERKTCSYCNYKTQCRRDG